MSIATLGPRFGPEFTGYPAHMSPEDFDIWQRFFPTIRANIIDLYFDVGLGQGKVAEGPEPQPFKDMWLRLNQKRADVIVTTLKEVWIIELRFQASLNAIGRLLGYGVLWQSDPPIRDKRMQLVLVTNARDPEVEDTATKQGISYLVI